MLCQLHRQRVEVELQVNEDTRTIRGIGSYEHDPDLGQALRILVADSNSEYSLLLSESAPLYQIERSTGDDCDFRIQLRPSAPRHSPCCN